MKSFPILALLSGSLLLSACHYGTSATAVPGETSSAANTPMHQASASVQRTTEGLDRKTFILLLQKKNYVIEQVGIVQQPFFRTEGTRLRISGANIQPAEIQTFEYETVSMAASDVSRITPGGEASWIEPDGTGKSVKITWAGLPHFYRSGRLIALYVGADPAIIALLEDQFGPQFAGR